MVYAELFFIIAFPQVINILTNYKYSLLSKYYFILISVFLILFASLRYGIGYDYNNYQKIFDLLHYSDFSFKQLNIEPGYYLIAKYCLNYKVLVLITTSLSVGLKILFIDKYSEDKLLSLLLYFSGVFLTFDMGVIRQGISIGIALFSLKYIKERSLFKFIIIIILASLFHISALVFLPLYWIADKQFSRIQYYFASLIVLIVSLLNISNLLVIVFQHIPLMMVQTKVMYYSSIYTGNSLTSLIKRILFLIFFVEFYKRYKISDSKSYIFLNGYFLSVVIMGLFSSIDIIGGRGSTGLYFLQIFVFSIILSKIKHIYFRLILFILIISLSIYSMLGPIKDGNNSNQPYTPYKNILINF